MAQFSYVGKDLNGKQVEGRIKATSRRDVLTYLKEEGINVIDVKKLGESIFSKDITIGSPVKLQDMVVYLRQFETLLNAGVSVVESTRVLADQTESKALKSALQDVEVELRSGVPLSEAAAKHKKIFPPMYINLVQAGEASGNLEETLQRLANYFEKQHETRRKVVSALAYPAVISVVAVAVVIFLLVGVVPTFAGMFADLGGELPWITSTVLGFSEWMQSFWWLILLFAIAGIATIFIMEGKSGSKYLLDYAILKMPIFGKLMQKAALARMTRTLSSLFSSSVPILQAMTIAARVVQNEVIAEVVKESREALEKGQPLTEPMRKHWIFPPLVTQMISIGERSGTLDTMLSKVADFYEAEVDTTTDRLKALIEPIMIVILAVIVGIIVLSIIVPMFEIFNQVGA